MLVVVKQLPRAVRTVLLMMRQPAGSLSTDSLKESDVLGWIYEANKEGDETADEYKARIESERTAKVQAQIDRKSCTIRWTTLERINERRTKRSDSRIQR